MHLHIHIIALSILFGRRAPTMVVCASSEEEKKKEFVHWLCSGMSKEKKNRKKLQCHFFFLVGPNFSAKVDLANF